MIFDRSSFGRDDGRSLTLVDIGKRTKEIGGGKVRESAVTLSIKTKTVLIASGPNSSMRGIAIIVVAGSIRDKNVGILP